MQQQQQQEQTKQDSADIAAIAAAATAAGLRVLPPPNQAAAQRGSEAATSEQSPALTKTAMTCETEPSPPLASTAVATPAKSTVSTCEEVSASEEQPALPSSAIHKHALHTGFTAPFLLTKTGTEIRQLLRTARSIRNNTLEESGLQASPKLIAKIETALKLGFSARFLGTKMEEEVQALIVTSKNNSAVAMAAKSKSNQSDRLENTMAVLSEAGNRKTGKGDRLENAMGILSKAGNEESEYLSVKEETKVIKKEEIVAASFRLWKGTAEESSTNKPISSFSKTPRTKNCEECANCLRDDCGACRSCLDKTKFGGMNTLRKRCVHRLCLNRKTGSSTAASESASGEKRTKEAATLEVANDDASDPIKRRKIIVPKIDLPPFVNSYTAPTPEIGPGWAQLLVRRQLTEKFDRYYISPEGKKLRSMVEVLRCLPPEGN
eukprot:CAMPEP_0181141310 /NCGR_PEP_ID=MMETSP1071-20121207/35756_1 /TAXON_ID=35127 /ORGANISM="Thalassiosira sp., Strain NH16" /LENGTH=435 /DNA_ID=CAMNT_0023228293 /DNA_START=357 /DNA_END=1664 /DNA_ORIENTATION=-